MEVIRSSSIMSIPNTYPSESILEKIEEIATISRTLSRKQRELTRANGLYVGKGNLPGGAVQYLAGGKFIVRLAFVRNTDSSIQIKKYRRGNWEFKVDDTLQLCRSLKENSVDPEQWASGQVPANESRIAGDTNLLKRETDNLEQRTTAKAVRYGAEEAINPYLLGKVSDAYQQHFEENNKHWHSRGLTRLHELRNLFLNKLKSEWPKEHQQLIANADEANEIEELLHTTIIKAYITGYMHGRGWITPEELNNTGLHLSEIIAGAISNSIEEAQSKRMSFNASFAEISIIGSNVPELL